MCHTWYTFSHTNSESDQLIAVDYCMVDVVPASLSMANSDDSKYLQISLHRTWKFVCLVSVGAYGDCSADVVPASLSMANPDDSCDLQTDQ